MSFSSTRSSVVAPFLPFCPWAAPVTRGVSRPPPPCCGRPSAGAALRRPASYLQARLSGRGPWRPERQLSFASGGNCDLGLSRFASTIVVSAAFGSGAFASAGFASPRAARPSPRRLSGFSFRLRLGSSLGSFAVGLVFRLGGNRFDSGALSRRQVYRPSSHVTGCSFFSKSLAKFPSLPGLLRPRTATCRSPRVLSRIAAKPRYSSF